MTENNNPKKPLLVSLSIKVRPYDIDFAGIVSNITYVRWVEDLRMCLLDTYYPLDAMIKDGNVPIIKSTYIEYRRPIRMFDTVTGYLWMESLESPNWTAKAEIHVAEKLTTSVTQTGVFIGLSTLKTSAVPEKLKKIFDEF